MLSSRAGNYRKRRCNDCPASRAISRVGVAFQVSRVNRALSLYLDIIRLLSALVVLLSHVSMQSLSGGQLGVMASTGVEAVDMFFVLSGFVIAHVCATREQDLRTYAISRAAVFIRWRSRHWYLRRSWMRSASKKTAPYTVTATRS